MAASAPTHPPARVGSKKGSGTKSKEALLDENRAAAAAGLKAIKQSRCTTKQWH
jgi:hypothetical protein